MTDKFDVSVIICVHTEERWNMTAAAIQSVLNQVLPPGELIIVVDHNPRLRCLLEEKFPGLIIIENDGMHGLADSRNCGIAKSKYNLVAFLDDDAIAEEDWLKHLLEGYAIEHVIGVGGRIDPLWITKRPFWFPEEFDWVVGCTYKGMPNKKGEVRNLIGANMSFHKESIVEINGFFNGIGHIGSTPLGGSDPEFCIRLRQKLPGKVLLYNPSAIVHHQVTQSRSNWSYFCKRCYYEGRSKAILTKRLGSNDSLSSERSYIKRTLPAAIFNNIKAAFLHHDFKGLAQAGAIIIGLCITSIGFIIGIVSHSSKISFVYQIKG